MDEVFGNSSTETVVSVQDLENRSSEELNLNESEINQVSHNDTEKTDKEYVMQVVEPQMKLKEVQCVRDSVIKCVSTMRQEKRREKNDMFKVPLPPVGPLRHTQSAIVQRPSAVWTRARAHSTSDAVQTKYHPYQNIPLNIASFSPKLPSYVNLPGTKSESCHNIHLSTFKEPSLVNSAPSTPRGSHSTKIKSSYIQLWTGTREDPATNDDTMSSGTGYVSMASPYVRSPNSSILSDLAYHLSHGGNNKSSEVYCPFCPRPFTKEQNLTHHIQAVHRNELQKVACGKETVMIQYCPRCQSRFFNLNLLPGHLLEFHRDCIIDILGDCKAVKCYDKEMKCPFCIKKVHYSKLGEENLLYHIVQLHCTEFENLIRSLYKPVECLKKSDIFTKMSTEDLARVLSFQPGVTSTPGLSLKFKGLSCDADMNLSVSHSSLEDTWTSHCGVKSENANPNVQSQVNKGILRSQTDLTRKPSVKRELRFSVPHVTSEEFFIPESPESSPARSFEEMIEQKENLYPYHNRRDIPIRVDSLSSADFIELTRLPSRKRRRLTVSLKSKSTFKKKKSETNQLVENVFEGLKSIGCGKNSNENAVATTATRTFRKPKPVPPPKVPPLQMIDKKSSNIPPPPSEIRMTVEETNNKFMEPSPFGNMKLYSPLKMFRCNGCRIKYCDNESLGTHIRAKHRGFMGFLRPHFGCGVCSAKFYENKYLVKHCLQHHTSLLEIRSPSKHKITIYRYNEND